jgi:pyruvate dehydrogenase E1 component alpha subunit
MHESVAEAVERARAGRGPTLLEARTYRFRGHHEGEEQILGRNVYRTVEEIEEARRLRDPIKLFKDRIRNSVGDDFFASADEEISEAVRQAVRFAEASELPSPAEADEFVYAAP